MFNNTIGLNSTNQIFDKNIILPRLNTHLPCLTNFLANITKYNTGFNSKHILPCLLSSWEICMVKITVTPTFLLDTSFSSFKRNHRKYWCKTFAHSSWTPIGNRFVWSAGLRRQKNNWCRIRRFHPCWTG